jgi:hypothetical protein
MDKAQAEGVSYQAVAKADNEKTKPDCARNTTRRGRANKRVPRRNLASLAEVSNTQSPRSSLLERTKIHKLDSKI